MKNKYYNGILFLLLATVFWGMTFSFTKYLLVYMPPLSILFIRFFISAIFIYVLFHKKINKDILQSFNSKTFFMFGVFNFFGYYFQTEGLKTTSASNAAFITAFCCLLVPILKRLHFKTKIKSIHYLTASISLFGIYILSFGFSIPTAFNKGDILVFVAAIFYAYFIIYMGILSSKFSSTLVVFYMFLFTSIYSLIFGFYSVSNFDIKFFYDAKAILSILVLTLFGTILANLLVSKGQSIVSSEKAALIYIFEPIVATLFAVAFIGEQLSFNLIFGSIFVFSGMFADVFIKD